MSLHPLGPFPGTQPPPQDQVAFQRDELGVILSLYGRMVAAGEWRDYGISCLRVVAVFSIFRRTAEQPLYRVEKRPKLRDKQGSEERRVGKECRIGCRSRWSPYH